MYYRSNILLDDSMRGVIGDFGFTIQLPKSFKNTTLLSAREGLPGTSGYRAPEYADLKYSTRSDVYAFGAVSFQLLSEK